MIYGMERWHDALGQRMMALSQAIERMVDDVNPLAGLLLVKGLYKSSQARGGGRPRQQHEGSMFPAEDVISTVQRHDTHIWRDIRLDYSSYIFKS